MTIFTSSTTPSRELSSTPEQINDVMMPVQFGMVFDAMPAIGVADFIKRPFFHVNRLATAVKQDVRVGLDWKMNAMAALEILSVINVPLD